MFCGLERIELATNLCPIAGCIYRDKQCACTFDETSQELLDVSRIAEMRGEKPYKVRVSVLTSKRNLEIGLLVDRYAEWVRLNFPRTVNKTQELDDPIQQLLGHQFGLSVEQQHSFWLPQIFEQWKERTEADVVVDLDEIQHTLQTFGELHYGNKEGRDRTQVP